MFDISFVHLAVIVTAASYIVKKPELLAGAKLLGRIIDIRNYNYQDINRRYSKLQLN